MKRQDFSFELPQELIAQDPLEDRAASRLLVLNKETGNISHRHFRDIRQYLKKGDCLVINDIEHFVGISYPNPTLFPVRIVSG